MKIQPLQRSRITLFLKKKYVRVILIEDYSLQRGQEVAKEPRIQLPLNAPHKTKGNRVPYLHALMALEPTSSTS